MGLVVVVVVVVREERKEGMSAWKNWCSLGLGLGLGLDEAGTWLRIRSGERRQRQLKRQRQAVRRAAEAGISGLVQAVGRRKCGMAVSAGEGPEGPRAPPRMHTITL